MTLPASQQVAAPGVYDIPAEVYHTDPCPEPSLSSSIATLLIDRSPRHAWQAHPRLNPDHEPETRRDFDLGTAAHALLLEGRSVVDVIDAADYRTKAAREARDAAYRAGKTPLLAHQWPAVEAMVEAARAQLGAHSDCGGVFEHGRGRPEQALIWREGEAWCRALVDWLPDAGEVLWDYKTTGGSANPDSWTRNQVWGSGRDIQAAFYLRGARAVLGWDSPRWRYVVQETAPPYALSVIELAPSGLEIAAQRCEAAIALWRECLAADRWPGYPARIAYVEVSTAAAWRWGEDAERRRAETERGRPYSRALLDWQAPRPGGAAA